MSIVALRALLVGLVAVLAGLYVFDFTVRANSTETQLDQCKAELFAVFDKLTPMIAAQRKTMAENFLKIVKPEVGLKMCRDVLTQSKAKRDG
jgi:hypothetical protein